MGRESAVQFGFDQVLKVLEYSLLYLYGQRPRESGRMDSYSFSLSAYYILLHYFCFVCTAYQRPVANRRPVANQRPLPPEGFCMLCCQVNTNYEKNIDIINLHMMSIIP